MKNCLFDVAKILIRKQINFFIFLLDFCYLILFVDINAEVTGEPSAPKSIFICFYELHVY